MELHIQKAQLNDSEAISRLSEQLGYTSSLSDIQKRLTLLLEKEEHCILVAEINNLIVGWIHCFYAIRVESDPFVEIGGLVVSIDYRKKGIGKQLIEQIPPWANEFHCSKIRVRCNTIRQDTHLFYQTLGFSVKKEQKIFEKDVC